MQWIVRATSSRRGSGRRTPPESRSLEVVRSVGEQPVGDLGELLLLEPELARSRARPLSAAPARGFSGPISFRLPNAIEWRSTRTRPFPIVSASSSSSSVRFLCAQCVDVARHHLRTESADLLELRLDALHRAAAIAVHDADVHAAFGELRRSRETEAARTSEHQRPAVCRKLRRQERSPRATRTAPRPPPRIAEKTAADPLLHARPRRCPAEIGDENDCQSLSVNRTEPPGLGGLPEQEAYRSRD